MLIMNYVVEVFHSVVTVNQTETVVFVTSEHYHHHSVLGLKRHTFVCFYIF